MIPAGGPPPAGGGARPAAGADARPPDAPGASPPDGAGEGFALALPVYEGPLELLLALIERRELDITAVSLVAVTEQYLAHVRSGDRIDLAALASFVAVGARLLLLKSRALLPPDPEADDAPAEAEQDPHALIDALVEYRRYRRAAEHLRALEEEGRTGYRREAAPPEVPPASGLDGVTVRRLHALFREALERLPAEEPHTELQRQAVRLQDRVALLAGRLEREGAISFREVIAAAASRLVVIVDFLAMLDLIRRRYAEARQDGAFGEIVLSRIRGAPPPDAESGDSGGGERADGAAGGGPARASGAGSAPPGAAAGAAPD